MEYTLGWFEDLGFVPHGYGYFWRTDVVWLHALSDLITGISYYLISWVLFVVAKKRNDVKLKRLALLFVLLIFACGTSHLFSILATGVPVYYIEGAIKVATALFALTIAFVLVVSSRAILRCRSSIYDELGGTHSEEEVKNERDTLRSVLDLNTDGWWDWDLINQTEEYLSPGFKKLLGYEDNELPNKSETRRRLIFEEDLKVAIENFKKHIASDGSHPYYQKVRYRHKDQSVVWVICRGVALKNSAGKYYRMIGVHFDITQLVKLEEQLKAANRGLREKNEEMEQFVNTVSHDLKSPIVTCMSFLEFLREDLIEENYESVTESVSEIERGLWKLRGLIGDLLELSRVGRWELNISDVDVFTIVRSLVKQLKSRCMPRQIQFDVSDDLPSVRGDRLTITQVFENLLTNAVKYGGLGGGLLMINVFAKKKPECVEFCVKDNGPGIESKYHKKIFELFQRLNKDHEGTGVGLAIVSRIMRLHGGDVWVKSEPNCGAEFWLRFPVEVE